MRENFIITLHRSDTSGNPKNCTYPQKVQVQNEEQLREAVRFDHVFVKFRDNRRKAQAYQTPVGELLGLCGLLFSALHRRRCHRQTYRVRSFPY